MPSAEFAEMQCCDQQEKRPWEEGTSHITS